MTAEVVSTAVTAVTGIIGNVVTLIGGNPLLMMFAVVPVIGAGVGLFRRLAR